jgi:sugar transferase (PEP-CTERM system associated)
MVRVFSHWFPGNTVFHVLLDAILLFVSMTLALGWLSRDQSEHWSVILPAALVFALVMMVVNTALGLYRVSPTRSVVQTTARVVMSLLLAVPVAYGVFEVLPWHDIRTEALQLTVLLVLAALLVIRAYAAHSGAATGFSHRVLILGAGDEAVTVEQSLRRFGAGVQVVGFVQTQAGEAASVAANRILPSGHSLAETVRQLGVDEVVVAVRERRGGVLPLRQLLDCKLAGVKVLDLSSYFERSLGQLRLDSLRASWMIFGDGFRQGFVRSLVKRLFDIAAALLLLALAWPIMLVTALLILLEDGAPVFYRQERVGQGGRTFRVIKFRSMRNDAERDGKPRWASSNDDRVTRIGHIIRKLRIDELPQILNVLKGDMSLVGPRPERPFFVDQLVADIPYYAVRHSVKPGVTGWAQVRYHYGASVDDAVQKLQYDLYYVKNHSLFLDIVVMFETIGVVLTGKGAQ